MKTLLPTQNEDDTLKYKFNKATLLSLHLKIKATQTEAWDRKECLYSWEK